MKQGNDCVFRQVVKETERAYLVEVAYNNRRDGSGLKYKWVAKSVCGEVQECRLGKFVAVPTHIIGNWQW